MLQRLLGVDDRCLALMSPPEHDLIDVAGACSDQIMVGRTGFSINRFDYGISEERGRRKTMEDHTVVIQDLGQCYRGISAYLLVVHAHGLRH